MSSIIILSASAMSKLPALAYQQHILTAVSRSFALTIPQLPERLQISIANAYLLCRIADTIEDDAQLSTEDKDRLNQAFLAMLKKQIVPAHFNPVLLNRFSAQTPPAEMDLLQHSADVLQITHSLNAKEQQALMRCVQIMSEGMAEFQRQQAKKQVQGLADVPTLLRYCYYVAGVVGEMLTSLFCDYVPNIAQQRQGLEDRAIAFGQGLQLTNILKDIWDDRARGICWLPEDIFRQTGFELGELFQANAQTGIENLAFHQGILQLVQLTVTQLDEALAYSLLLPKQEKGIRRFCLWAVAMAVLTLRNIAKQTGFYRPEHVKISRHQVRLIILLSYIWIDNDKRIQQLYQHWTAPLRA